MAIAVPKIGQKVIPWRSKSRGTKPERLLQEITVAVLPQIRDLSLVVPGEFEPLLSDVLVTIGRFDIVCKHLGIGISPLLVKTESIASSRYEQLNETDLNFMRATVGQRVSDVAIEMAAGLRALEYIVDQSQVEKLIDVEMLNSAHAILLKDDSQDAATAGMLRDFQNWLEGGNTAPVNASYIPPESSQVVDLIDDLLAFSNRNDLHPVVKAAIAHAQFESIHPYADGNGRIGRGLVTSILIKAGLTETTVVPLAAALLGARGAYIDALTKFRDGDAEPIVNVIANGLLVAASVGVEMISELALIPATLRNAHALNGTMIAARITDLFLRHTAISAEMVADELGVSLQSALNALGRLQDLEVVTEITGRKRERYWICPEITDLLANYADKVALVMNERNFAK